MSDQSRRRPLGSGWRGTLGIYGYCASFGDTFGGVESHLAHLATALVRSGWRVVVHCMSADPPEMTRVVVVYHGVDPDLFTPRDGRWCPGGWWLHVSRLSVPFAAHKNLAWSCEFLHAARDLDPVPRLAVCGGGDADRLVTDFAAQNGLDGQITVTGFVNQQVLAKRMRAASLLLVPSMMEAGCTILVEAVLSGCLPVVLDHGGSGEVMRSLGLADSLLMPVTHQIGDHVRTVVPDLDHAREVVTAAYADPERVQRLLDRASAIARERFSLHATTCELAGQLRRRRLVDLTVEEEMS